MTLGNFSKVTHFHKIGSHLEGLTLIALPLQKISDAWKNGSHLENWVTLVKIGSHLEKWVTLGKIIHAWKNGSPLGNFPSVTHFSKLTFVKIFQGHTWKKWVTLGKLVTKSHLEKLGFFQARLAKIGRTWKNGSHLENFPSVTHFSKRLFLQG